MSAAKVLPPSHPCGPPGTDSQSPANRWRRERSGKVSDADRVPTGAPVAYQVAHLGWGPRYEYDLADDADVPLMHERVVLEAQTPEDLLAPLNADVLRSHWQALFLPGPARAAGESRFPELASPAAAAA